MLLGPKEFNGLAFVDQVEPAIRGGRGAGPHQVDDLLGGEGGIQGEQLSRQVDHVGGGHGGARETHAEAAGNGAVHLIPVCI